MTSLLPRVLPHFKKPWQLMVSVCVTRMNRVPPPLTDLEQRYARLQHQLEYEASVFNDHEHTKIDLQRSAAMLQNNDIEESEAELLLAKEQLDDLLETEAGWKKDEEALQLATSATEADEKGTLNTINRRLEDILHCVVPDDNLFPQLSRMYPYTTIQGEESLRSAGERLLRSHSLDNDVVFFSNAPIGVLKVDYGEEEGRGELFRGAKVFFLRGHLRDNISCTQSTHSDVLEWLTLDELAQCADKYYFKKVKPLVL